MLVPTTSGIWKQYTRAEACDMEEAKVEVRV